VSWNSASLHHPAAALRRGVPVTNAVSPEYFDMLGMRIVKGRGFQASGRTPLTVGSG
jgi:hypothetical protein